MKTPILIPSTRPPGWRRTGLVLALLLSVASLLLCWPPSAAHASTHTWDGSYSGNWSAGQNWTNGTAPSDGDDLVFPAGAANLANTNNSALSRVRSITFSGAGYVLRGIGTTTAITLTNGLNATHAAGTSTVELDVVLGAAQEFQCTTAGAMLYVTGDINLSGFTLTADGSGNVQLGGILSGAGGLTKNGLGYLWLAGTTANSYSGVTRVNTGTLMLAKAGGNSVPNGQLIIGDDLGGAGADLVREQGDYQIGNIPITINSSGWLDVDDYDDTVGAITFNGGQAGSAIGTLYLGGNVTVNASASVATISGQLNLGSVTRTFDVGSGSASPDLDITASITGSGGLTKTGAGLLRLLGANSYSGSTTVNEGNVYVANANAFGTTASGTTITGSGSIQLISANVGVESLTLNKPASVGGVLSASGDSSWAGDVILNTNVSISTGGTLEFSGVISGPGGLTFAGAGTYTLSGTNANTYAGDTFVNAGTLLLNKAVTDGALPGPGGLIIGDGLGGHDADVVRLLRDFQIDSTVDITVNVSGKLDLNDNSDTVGGLHLTSAGVWTGDGTLTLSGNVWATTVTNRLASIYGHLGLGAATRTFDVTNIHYPAISEMVVHASVSGSVGLQKIGGGSLRLEGSNSFSGLTTVAEGSLVAGNDHALGGISAGTVVENGALLGIAYAHVGDEALTLNGLGPHGTAALQNLSVGYSNSWAGPITLAADTAVWVTGGADDVLNLLGAINGPGGFTKTGDGTLVLSGSSGNTYAGDTFVEAGTLELGKTAGAGVAIRNGSLTIGDGVGGVNADVVRFTANNQFWSTVPVVITSTGWLDLNDFSDTVGPLTIAGGRASSGTGGLLYLGGTVTSLDAVSGCSSIEGNVYLSSTRTFDIANSSCSPDLNVNAAILGTGGITKTGAGALGLYASNSYSGVLTVNDGLVYLYHDAALGSTAGATVVNDGGVLVLANGRAVGTEPLTLNGSGDGYAGALTSIGGSNSWAGTVTLATDSIVTVQTNRQLNLAGVVAGPAGFTKAQPGTLILSGAAANTFAGNVEVDEGTLLLDKAVTDGALPGPGDLVIGDGTGGDEADVVRELRNFQIASSVNTTVNESGLLDLNDQSDSVGGLNLFAGRVTTGTGTLTLGSNVTAQSVVGVGQSLIYGHLSLGNATRIFTITSVVGAQTPQLQIPAEVSGLGGLTKSGDGALALKGANTYSGLTTVTDGELCVLNDSALGSTAAGTIVQPGACLWVGGFATSTSVHVGVEPLTLSGCLAGGAFSTPATSNSWAGPITLATNATVSVADEDDYLNLAGPIGGPGGLTKGDYPRPNVGTLILSGADANTYAGDTIVGEGTLVLDKSTLDGAVPANLIICDATHYGTGAGFLRLERDNQIANTADIVVSGSGRLDLNGHYDRVNAVTGNGAVTLGAGHLLAGHSGSSFTFDGLVSGTGYLWKVGAGTWTLTGNNLYTGTTRIETGTLRVNGSQPASDVLIESLGTLGGTGSVGRVTSTGGVLSPGVSPGTLTSSNVLFDSASDFFIELTDTGADQLNVRGKVGLANASLVLSAPGLLPAEGQQFVILNNDGSDAITGIFAGLAEGALISAGPRQFRITYAGNGGNDVVLIATNTAALRPTLSVWRTSTNTVVVSWPQSDIAWLLHATTNLASTPISWTELPPPYQTNGVNLQFTEPLPVGNKFYRLHKP